MKIRPYRFMSWLGFISCIVASFMPEKNLAFGYYKTFVFLTLSQSCLRFGTFRIQSRRVIKNEKLDISGNFCIVDRSDYVGSISRAIQVKGHQIT